MFQIVLIFCVFSFRESEFIIFLFHHYQTLLGGKRLKPIIPFVEVVKILHRHEAPADLIIKFLNLIEDGELKLQLAKEFKYHNLVLELCVNLKDRQTLLQYVPKLKLNSPESFYAQDILRSQNVKWKN